MRWVRLTLNQAPRDLDLARRVVAQEELDVLVYPDLGMEPLTYFMAFARLAPVQVLAYTRRWAPGLEAIWPRR